ncbi:PDZ domain-containing protein [candidate division KSB1 bacterium]|nr:PDZ domain-containing protein [candidate division KSB1 bacterium]
MFKKCCVTLGIFLLLAVLTSVHSQVVVQKIGGDQAGIQLVPEVGVLVVAQQDTIIIDKVLPPEARAEENKTLNLQDGDQILMVNAQPVKSIKEFKAQYDHFKIGDEIKWGIRRGKEFRIITFKKADPEKMHAGKKIMLRVDASPDGKGVPQKEYSYMLGKEADAASASVNAGFIFAESDGKLKITHILEHAPAEVKAGLQVGDRLLALNGQTLTGASDFLTVYAKITTGQTVQLKFSRNGKESEVQWQKSESRAKVLIQKGKADEK